MPIDPCRRCNTQGTTMRHPGPPHPPFGWQVIATAYGVCTEHLHAPRIEHLLLCITLCTCTAVSADGHLFLDVAGPAFASSPSVYCVLCGTQYVACNTYTARGCLHPKNFLFFVTQGGTEAGYGKQDAEHWTKEHAGHDSAAVEPFSLVDTSGRADIAASPPRPRLGLA